MNSRRTFEKSKLKNYRLRRAAATATLPQHPDAQARPAGGKVGHEEKPYAQNPRLG
jgi:hypothetical protein